MARWIPLVRDGGFYASNAWTPLVMDGGYTQGGGEPEPEWEYKYVAGMSPLLLAAALGKPIKSLTQYGLCSQADTPTPSTPQDILCNNGTLKMVDDELPAGYKRVLGFTLNNNSYWEIPNFPLYGSDTLRFSFEATDACNVIGAYSGSASGNNYSLYVGSSSNYLRYKNGAYNSAVDFNTRYNVEISPTGSSGMKVNSTWTEQTFTTPTNFCIGTTSASASSAKLKGNLYGNVEVVGRTKLVPCERVSDNVLGYYDLVGEVFYEQASSYDGAVSLGYDGSHYHLVVVGTPEVLAVALNYASGGLDGYGTYVSPTSTAGNRAYKWLNGLPNGTYRFAVDGAYEIIVQWRDPADPNDGLAQSYENLSGWITSDTITLDKASGGYGIAVRRTGGTTITPDNFDGTLYCMPAAQTAFVPDLYAVGDSADEVEIISGGVTRKVGIAVLTGEEAGWALSDSGTTHRFRGVKPRDCYTPASRAPSVCTHFKYVSTGSAVGGMFIGASQYWYFIPTDQTIDTADEWTAWLKAQYAQGTPVIVLYPLKEETTESVTAQPLSTSEGDNVVSVTANVSPIQLSAEYAILSEEG